MTGKSCHARLEHSCDCRAGFRRRSRMAPTATRTVSNGRLKPAISTTAQAWSIGLRPIFATDPDGMKQSSSAKHIDA